MPNVEQECGNCRYWIDGVCKRYPPCCGADGNSFPVPPKGEEDWCGEWCEMIVAVTPPTPDLYAEEKGE